MKALEKIKEMIDFCNAVGCHRAIYESLEYVQLELEELEALQQPKSCEGCLHNNEDHWESICDSCVRQLNDADYYEPKEQ